MKKNIPQIIFTPFSPYMVTDLVYFEGENGEQLQTETVMSLCRCGHSAMKPDCDGSHASVGFVGVKDPDCPENITRDYTGTDITIHDNRSVCCHDGSCIQLLPEVFRKNCKPWIDPNAAGVRQIIETIEHCPSGALSYTIGSRRYQNLKQDPAIHVVPDGPLHITGHIILKDNQGSTPECREHYTLCRCGKAKNKPFCDGSHTNEKENK